jgi:hypothetical protein
MNKPYDDIRELEDKDLYDLIEQGDYVNNFLKSKMGAIVIEACKRIAEKIDRQIAFKVNPHDTSKVTELQTKLRFYKYEIYNLFEVLKEDGEKAQIELEERKYGEPPPEQGNEQDS